MASTEALNTEGSTEENDEEIKKDRVVDDDTVSVSEEEGYEDDEDDMPLLKYARLSGSLPRLPRTTGPTRPLSVECTCSAVARLVLTPEMLVDAGTGDTSSKPASATSMRASDLVWNQPHFLLAMGFQDGTVSLLDAKTADSIAPHNQLVVASRKDPIVDVCFDSSGTFLAAMNRTRMCAIFELKYTAVSETPAAPTDAGDGAQAEQGNMFTNFLGFKGATAASSPETADVPSTPPKSALISTSSSIQVSRISYPASFGIPTVVKLDPAYKRRREKSLLVGFADGRLVLTKRGYVFQRRSDAVIYQGVADKDYQGIESIEWRGHFVAWADASGIKVFDIESLTRIAHIDRPSGARTALYPTISSLYPSLLFETNDSLLVAWGDCLMNMSVKETIVNRRPEDSSGTAAGSGPESPVVKRRTVKCVVAWELDCVACGVVPLDEDHVIILGLVPVEEEEVAEQDPRLSSESNVLEMQVVSRKNGTVAYADALPVLRSNPGGRNMVFQDSASRFRILSSFATPRMEDPFEAEVDGDIADEEVDFQMSLFTTSGAAPKPSFRDAHLKWSLREISYQDIVMTDVREPEKNAELEKGEKVDTSMDEDHSDTQSIDSDDYSFVLHAHAWASANTNEIASNRTGTPPFMLVCAPSDTILVRTREIDDAISHALATNKRGLALKRALQHNRHLHKYEVNHLIDEYLSAVLRIKEEGEQAVDGEDLLGKSTAKRLSIRRLQLAAESMPVLLGGHVSMWEKWFTVFSLIPGGLFVLREYLPVRDPILPPAVYENAIIKMLQEVEGMLVPDDESSGPPSSEIFLDGLRNLISALRAWGPSQCLREKIRLYKHQDDEQQKKSPTEELAANMALVDAENSLEQRLHQSAAGYLQLRPVAFEPRPDDAPAAQHGSLGENSDSLFDVDAVLSVVASHLPIIEEESATMEVGIANNQAALEACAELNMMKGNYDIALRCFLVNGSLHAKSNIEGIEKMAIESVNGGLGRSFLNQSLQDGSHRYDYVIAMIEYHHLHQYLLDEDFLLPASPETETSALQELSPPLISLMRLVGLEQVGDFLVEHCVPPPAKKTNTVRGALRSQSSAVNSEERNTHGMLPINLVVEQLRPFPKLLHWYLHQIFLRKPEMYVKFPSTAVPPKSVTDLHRSHLDLYVAYTDKRDSAECLAGTEVYNLERTTTPLFSFLKAALPLGGIRPDEVRRLLEAERSETRQGVPSGVVQQPHWFALELAFVIEHYGKSSEEDAKTILDLYLNGTKSLMLAVAFAQRNEAHATMLWDTLIDYCLKDDKDGARQDGSLFGSLLECAALSGADLAHLVTQIPQGMRIEGLRPRLVAAVADYRLKLKMHEAASETGSMEKNVLLRELAHRSRRGMLFQSEKREPLDTPARGQDSLDTTTEVAVSSLPRPHERPNRYRLSFALPIR